MLAEEVSVRDGPRLSECVEPVYPLLGDVELQEARLQAKVTLSKVMIRYLDRDDQIVCPLTLTKWKTLIITGHDFTATTLYVQLLCIC